MQKKHTKSPSQACTGKTDPYCQDWFLKGRVMCETPNPVGQL